ncbi:ABC transporter permease [Sinosporangium siamense]|uniref:Taurine ABC transporter permease n=1 Tax=Sinosporangium siamense TaxID=1367973 RepID=A0A919RFE3_9ACTN|nr:ABC transporter permease [Sinosporangium siamense]GII92633.1 taurine ABC transporter permease [Sinosporangium siamense]
MRLRLISLGSLAAVAAVWAVLTLGGFVDKLFLPGPQDLMSVVTESWQELLANLGFTLTRQAVGFLIGSALGIGLGLLMASSRVVNAVLDPLVELIRPIPPLAIIPLLILWLGIGVVPQVLLVVFGCFVIMVVSTVEAVRNVPRIYLSAARTLGAGSTRIYRTIVMPAIVPALVGSIRVAAAASFGLVVAAEFMGAQEGIGYQMILAQRYLRTDQIIVCIAVITVTAWLVDQAIRRLERRYTGWTERHVTAGGASRTRPKSAVVAPAAAAKENS